jgi:hypothetical protein
LQDRVRTPPLRPARPRPSRRNSTCPFLIRNRPRWCAQSMSSGTVMAAPPFNPSTSSTRQRLLFACYQAAQGAKGGILHQGGPHWSAVPSICT